jgi:hypothetical protein
MPAKYMQVTEAHHEDDAFYQLGGAGFRTEAETLARFKAVPENKKPDPDNDEPTYVLDLLDEDSIVDDKRITAATARRLLGEDLDTLREKAKADNAVVQARIAADPAERAAERTALDEAKEAAGQP